MKLHLILLTAFACQGIVMAGITTSGSVVKEWDGSGYDGSDPWIISIGRLNVGGATAVGNLAITSGSVVTAPSQINIISPTSGGATSSVLVDGSGSNIATSALFVEGGLLRVSNGASADVGDLGSRSVDGRTAQTFIEGPGTIFNANSLGFVGNEKSQISVTDGASLITRQLDVWSYGSSFTVTVGGGTNTSQWLQNGLLTMGTGGNDLIDIRGGGLVRIGGGSLVVGYSATNSSGLLVPGTGTIRVDGTDGPAELQLQVSPYIGNQGTGNLIVTNGGKVTTTDSYQMYVGSNDRGGTGRVSVGGGSSASTVSGLTLQVSGPSSRIEVLDNGTLSVGSLRAVAGSRLVVGGGSGPAVLNVSQGATPLDDGIFLLREGSRLDIRQGGTVNVSEMVVGAYLEPNNSQLSFDGGTITGAGFLGGLTASGYYGGLPVQFLSGGGTIQAASGKAFSLGATTGAGVLSKTGAGVLQFEGLANHAGTRVVEGRLYLAAGSRTTGTVDVLAGARLAGTGVLEGNLTLHQGAVIAPGNSLVNSPSTLQVGSSTWMSGGRYEWEINNALGNNGANWDLVQINGSLDLVGLSATDAFVIAIRSLFESGGSPGVATGFDPQSSYRFTILTTTSGITGFDPSDFRLDLTGFANDDLGDSYWQLQEWNNGLDLVYNSAPVPEPGGILLIAAGAFVTLSRRRRRVHG